MAFGQPSPCHNTIAYFRKNNPKAIKKVFHATVSIAKNHKLIGATLIAGDSTKLRAQNSKKNIFKLKKVARHIDYINKKLEEHSKELSKADSDSKEKVKQKIKQRKLQREKYIDIQTKLKSDTTTENPQISTSDPDRRHQILRGTITEVSYTDQTTVDADHKLLIDYKITNQNDKKAMGDMLRRVKTILRTNAFKTLYDKGYHIGSEFKIATNLGINTLVANSCDRSQKSGTKTNPQQNELISNGSWYKARNYRFKRYKTRACKQCPIRSECTTAKQNGKIVQRSEFTPYIEQNAREVEKHPDTYKKRQALVKHLFRTMKMQWGF